MVFVVLVDEDIVHWLPRYCAYVWRFTRMAHRNMAETKEACMTKCVGY